MDCMAVQRGVQGTEESFRGMKKALQQLGYRVGVRYTSTCPQGKLYELAHVLYKFVYGVCVCN